MQDEHEHPNNPAPEHTPIGTYIAGGVATQGGDFVAGNKNVAGDEVHGNKIVNNFSQSEQELLEKFVTTAVLKYTNGLVNDLNQSDTPSKPYKFLDHYRLTDTAIFFGRDRTSDKFYEAVFKTSARLTVLHAPSGTGKSSLLRAGLAVRVIKAPRRHLPIIVRCGTNPCEAIKRELASRAENDGEFPPARWPDVTLRQLIGLLVRNLSQQAELVLVLDQFEDLFTLLLPAVYQPLLDELADCITDTTLLRLRVVFSIRKEQFADLDRFGTRLPQIFENRFRLETMDVEDVKEAIAEPVKQLPGGITYEDLLVERLSAEWGKGRFGLPELQIICKHVYDKTIADGRLQITYESYRVDGEYQGILQGYLDRALDQRFIEVDKIQAAWSILEALLGGSDQRPIIAQEELSRRAGIGSALLSEILGELLSARLIKREDHGHYTLAQDYMTIAVYEHLKLSPARLEIKLLREQLQRDVEDWRADRSLISRGRLEELHHKGMYLGEFDDDTILCVLLSTAWAGLDVRLWANRVQPHLLDRIVADLTSADMRARCQAARALGSLAWPEMIDALLVALAQVPDDESRQEIAKALGAMPEAINRLIDLLRDSSENSGIQRAIAPVIGKLGDQRAVEPLMKIVETSTDEGVWAAVAQAIAQLGQVQAIRLLCATLRRAKSGQVRGEIVSALKDLLDMVLAQEAPLVELLGIYKSRQAYLLTQRDFYGELFVDISVLMELDDREAEVERLENSLKEISSLRQAIDEPQVRIFLLNARYMELLGDIGGPQQVVELALAALEVDLQAQNDALTTLRSQLQLEELDIMRSMIGLHKHRLWHLERDKASAGTDVDYSIVAQIQDLAAEIQNVSDKLGPIAEALEKLGPRVAAAVLTLLPRIEHAANHAMIAEILGLLGFTIGESLVNALQGQVDAPTRSILVGALNANAQRIAEDHDLIVAECEHRAELQSIYRRALAYLEQRAAAYGPSRSFSAPVSLLFDIEQTERKIEQRDQTLDTLSKAETEEYEQLEELRAAYARRLRFLQARRSKFEQPQELTWLQREIDAVKQALAQNAADVQVAEAISSQFDESVVIPFATALQQIPDATSERLILISLVRLGRLKWLPLTSILAVVANPVSKQLAALLQRVSSRWARKLFPKVFGTFEHLKSQMHDIHVAVEQLLDASQNSAIPITLDQSAFEKVALLAAEAFSAVLDRSSMDDADSEEATCSLEGMASLESLRLIFITGSLVITTDLEPATTIKLAQERISRALEKARSKLTECSIQAEEIRTMLIKRSQVFEEQQAVYGSFEQPLKLVNISAETKENLDRLQYLRQNDVERNRLLSYCWVFTTTAILEDKSRCPLFYHSCSASNLR